MHHEITNQMAASATIHCLAGCTIGEIADLVIGEALGTISSARNYTKCQLYCWHFCFAPYSAHS
jgi:hypothetical protein